MSGPGETTPRGLCTGSPGDLGMQEVASPKGPKYLYATKYGYCSGNFHMVAIRIPHIGT